MKRREMMPSDFVSITHVDGHIVEEMQRQNLILLARAHIAKGPCATIEEGGRILVCGGVWVRWPGCAEAWVRFSLPTGPRVAWEVRDILQGWIKSEKLDRVDATTQVDWQEGRKFLEWMGMRFECIMRKYGPDGMDKALYSWVSE
jgi:hypothetical protein